MKLSEALGILLNPSISTPNESMYEARRLMGGHLKQLVKREQGRTDSELSEVNIYQEFHHQNIADVGVAFNENRVWMCLNGVALFRAKAMGNQMFTEYYDPESKR
jgi:hypothetical protein